MKACDEGAVKRKLKRPRPKITLTQDPLTGWWQYEFAEGIWYFGSYPTKRYTKAMAKKVRDHYDPRATGPCCPDGH